MTESGCIKPNPTSQGRPEIKYHLQGVKFKKESLLARLSLPFGRSLSQVYLTIGHVLYM